MANSKQKAISHLKNEKGFFFLAMIVVILGVSVAAGIALLNIAPSISTNAVSITYDKAEKLRTAITKYRGNHGGASGTFPANFNALVVKAALEPACGVQNSDSTNTATFLTLQGWCGPYLDINTTNDATEYLRDGWGNNFIYAGAGVFRSIGPNGVDNAGAGDDLVFNP